ncbi:MAG: hypothetical protein BGP25_02965 [Lysobacterales bacterium 63-13]|nr:MAG: hypothetical protein BGP25_02965 [Xanthomonadales bacterium 63-13]
MVMLATRNVRPQQTLIRKPMSASVKRQWQHFVSMPSGRRFQTRHRLRRPQGSSLWRKALIVGLGGLVMLAGVVMLVMPGPGLLAMILGAALIAEESLIAARLLDRLDRFFTRQYARWRAYRASRG